MNSTRPPLPTKYRCLVYWKNGHLMAQNTVFGRVFHVPFNMAYEDNFFPKLEVNAANQRVIK
jgi:hypothetical protein